MNLRNDYCGPFDPQLMLADFSRDFLSRLAHEFNLIGHLYDRVGQPLVALEYGADGFTRSGIEEWQGARFGSWEIICSKTAMISSESQGGSGA